MYEDKKDSYYSFCRTDLLEFVPRNRSNKILEIGAGSGETLLKAKESGLAEYVVGVDLAQVENSNQSHPAMDRFITGNIENLKLDFADNFFDVIICGDVLEHLLDPWQCLVKLKPLLRDGGVIIASIPNVRYWKVSMGLVFSGRWNYCDSGTLDRTHLRFFVRQTVQRLFTDAGFTISTMKCQGSQKEYGFSAWLLNLLTFELLTDLLTMQFVVVADKRLPPETSVRR